MITLDFFGRLSPEVQLALIVGLFALLLVLACSRSAGNNLLLFFRGVLSLLRQRERWRRAEVKKHRGSISRSRHHFDEEQPLRHMLVQKQEHRRDGE